MKTMICVLLDRSGSMQGEENNVIEGVNKFLAEQKAQPGEALIAFVRFDTHGIVRFRPMADLKDVPDLTREEYQPSGGTPLYDAIGRTLSDLDVDWAAHQPEQAIVLIVTDGRENESREYKLQQVKDMVKSRQDSGKWAFIYIGADVDSLKEATDLGIMASNSAAMFKGHAGMAAATAAYSNTVSVMRATGNKVAENLGGTIAEDGTLTKYNQPGG